MIAPLAQSASGHGVSLLDRSGLPHFFADHPVHLLTAHLRCGVVIVCATPGDLIARQPSYLDQTTGDGGPRVCGYDRADAQRRRWRLWSAGAFRRSGDHNVGRQTLGHDACHIAIQQAERPIVLSMRGDAATTLVGRRRDESNVVGCLA
jgi:hypothetical protein